LVTRVDHNGKVFTDQVRKQKVASIIQTTSSRIRGVLFYDVDARLKDDLNNKDEAFIAVADAEFLNPAGEVIGRTSFICVNKNAVEWIMPADAAEKMPN
jgi:hypothetical protein